MFGQIFPKYVELKVSQCQQGSLLSCVCMLPTLKQIAYSSSLIFTSSRKALSSTQGKSLKPSQVFSEPPKVCSYTILIKKNKVHILILQKFSQYILSLMLCSVQFLSFLIFYHYRSIFPASFLPIFSLTVSYFKFSLIFPLYNRSTFHLYNRSTFVFLNYQFIVFLSLFYYYVA